MSDPLDGADRTHNPKVIGSNPIPATKEYAGQSRSFGAGSSVSQIAIPTFIPTTVYDCFYEGNQRKRRKGVRELRAYVGRD